MAVVYEFRLGQTFAQICITVILSFAINHLVQVWVLSRFGTEREVSGKKVLARSHTSSMIGLLFLVLIIALTFVAILNILNLDNWLQTSSIIGAFLLVLYASKDYLLGDVISSLVFHYNRTVEPGNVVRVQELNILGVVQQVTLTQTTFRDLVQGHKMTIANSKLRANLVENFSQNTGLVKDYIDFNIGYDNDSETVQSVLLECWEQAQAAESAIETNKPSISVIAHGDHCVVWRVLYSLSNPYKIVEAKNAFKAIALQHCHAKGVLLSTPLTHQVEATASINKA